MKRTADESFVYRSAVFAASLYSTAGISDMMDKIFGFLKDEFDARSVFFSISSDEFISESMEGKGWQFSVNTASDYRKESEKYAVCVNLNHSDSQLKGFCSVTFLEAMVSNEISEKIDFFVSLILGRMESTVLKTGFYENLRRICFLIADVTDQRIPGYSGHSRRVCEFSLLTGNKLGFTGKQLENLEISALLHDFGVVFMPDEICHKKEQLSQNEREMFKNHPVSGCFRIDDIPVFKTRIEPVLYHHERYDGKGYPYRKSGDNIPVEASVLAVAETFDALTSYRPYREKLRPEKALEELRKNSGTQFDPAVVNAFCEVMEMKLKHPSCEEKSIRIRFHLEADFAENVYVTGEFNNWSLFSDPMKKQPNGTWVLDMDLRPGRYEYNFVADGIWLTSEHGEHVETTHRGRSSVIIVGDHDEIDRNY